MALRNWWLIMFLRFGYYYQDLGCWAGPAATNDMQPVVVASSSGGSSELLGSHGPPRCEQIAIPMCRGIGYNLTYMPNELHHDNQEEAGYEVHQFWPLVEINCSPELKFFLCSMYTPICFEDYQKPLKACRSVCQRARHGCEPVMSQYGFKWPERMNCDKLPVQGGDENILCMEPPENVNGIYHPASSSNFGFNKPQTPPHQLLPVCKPGVHKNCRSNSGSGSGGSASDLSNGNLDCGCKCRPPLIALERSSPWYNRNVSVAKVNNCALPCSGVFFTDEEKEFAAKWLTLWAGLCSVATLMTLTTFLIDTERFKYPERPIVFLSACYFLVSVGFLIRVFVGHAEVVCESIGNDIGNDEAGNGSANNNNNDQRPENVMLMVIYNSSGPKACTLVFLLIYFFGMSSSIWWVILTFTWFLAAGFKWSNEAIASYSQYFHLAAWLIPTVKSVAVLIMSAVDGDSLVGICYVGNQNPGNLKKFVLIPLIVYLIIGTSFLVAGFVSLFRIRNVIKKQGALGGRSKADKLEKLMIRIGIFSLMYTVPATVLIGCYYYESSLYNEWMNALVCPCSSTSFGPLSASPASLADNANYIRNRALATKSNGNKPIFAVIMLKYFMALAVGISSGVWIWSGKTVGSWNKLWRRLFGQSGGGSSGLTGAAGKNHKSALINNPGTAAIPKSTGSSRLLKQQYMPPPSIPIPPVPASSSTLLSGGGGPHGNPTTTGGSSLPSSSQFMSHHNTGAASSSTNFHHHVIKQQSQQAPLSHV